MNPAKLVGQILGTVLMLPYLALYGLGRCVLGRERAFSGASEWLACCPGMIGVYMRQAFYRCTLAHVGRDVYFGFMTVLSKPAARIGDRAYLGRFCSLGWVDIGADVMLADGVQVLSGKRQHGTSGDDRTPMRDQPQTFTQVTIGAGAWLGAGAIVLADVGEHALVAAGAVVVKPVAAHTTVGGVPARVLHDE